MNPENENAPAWDRGARKDIPAASNARSSAVGKPEQDWEDRRNAAACFRNKNKTADFHPAYVGVMVVEGLKDGDKLWVNVHVRQSRRGDKYLTVVLKRQER